ncbi:MAG: FHA domain-containing protein [Isosphaeraceae bacterium]|nr:FHA domain-containing protein [Isosphaeraceae bacterium]
MSSRLVALDEGPDIPLDGSMVVVGRHPQCDARLDSLRVSRHHCCMTNDNGEVVVRDLGSTNGIRINGQRVEIGRLRPGDELSIAHIRYRLESGQGHDATLAEGNGVLAAVRSSAAAALLARPAAASKAAAVEPRPLSVPLEESLEKPLAAMMREILPPNVADKCRIQIIVQMNEDDQAPANPEGDH